MPNINRLSLPPNLSTLFNRGSSAPIPYSISSLFTDYDARYALAPFVSPFA